MDDKTVDIYNKIAGSYDSRYSDSQYLRENKLLFGEITRVLEDKDKLLDVGCGTGLLLENIKLSSERYLGVDPSKNMLKIARRKFPTHRFVRGRLEDVLDSFEADIAVALFGVGSYLSFTDVKAIMKHNKYMIMFCNYGYFPSTYDTKIHILKQQSSEWFKSLHSKGEIYFEKYLVVKNI